MDIVVQNQKLRTIFSFKSTFYARSCDQFYGQIDNNDLLESDYSQSDSQVMLLLEVKNMLSV